MQVRIMIHPCAALGAHQMEKKMFKQALSAVALAALTACGGGGGDGGATAVPVQSTPAEQPVATAAVSTGSSIAVLNPQNPGCTMVAANHMDCNLYISEQPLGVGVAPGVYVTFTNRTLAALQINSIEAETGERQFWSEFCAYLDLFKTGQDTAGKGEVGCASKQIGSDYAPIRFGGGLIVLPGSSVYLASHTEPTGTNHTFALDVKANTTGNQAWRMPQQDEVHSCNGQQKATVWSTWANTKATDVQLTGVSIYSESGGGSTTLNGSACIYVFTADGATKYANCDAALKTKGEVSFPPISIAPGESIAAQGVNSCSAPQLWGWAAFLQVR